MSKGEAKVGILIANLGSPDAPSKKALRRYLKQFLSDKRVIQPVIPRWMWWLILNGIILNTRPKKSAKLYQSIWNRFGPGAPLVAISEKQLKALQERHKNSSVSISLGMRYGSPSLEKGLEVLLKQGVQQLIVLPLYPQYSKTTTESTFDVVRAMQQKHNNFPAITYITDYHQNPLYIEALKQSILKHWSKHGKPQKLIISFHGIPKIYCENGDIYPQHCEKTTELLVQALALKEDQYLLCYQSRFGKLEWLQPYLDKTLQSLPEQGIKNVQVICPGFAADCLETLEEIEQENKHYFLQAGGQQYSYINALNDSTEHIDVLNDVILSKLS